MTETPVGSGTPADWPAAIPFTLELANAPERRLVCEVVARRLPGKRLACFGRWGDRSVFIKLFTDPKRAQTHARREQDGARALLERGIPTPRLLYSGITAAGEAQVLVFERIEPALSMLNAWNGAGDWIERKELARALVAAVAAQHQAGLKQEDMHLNNFVLSHGEVLTVDGAAVEIAGEPLGKRAALDNLGLLFAQFSPEHDALADELYPYYAKLRGFDARESDRALLKNRIAGRRSRRKREYLSKIFRECSAVVRASAEEYVYLCERRYHSRPMQALLENPEAAFGANARYLKRGNSATLVEVAIDGRRLVIKRYNPPGFWLGLKRSLRKTRAARSWRNAHLLGFHGIATAAPVALIERRLGPLKRLSYFVSEHVEGSNCREYFSSGAARDEEKRAAAESVARLLQAMWGCNVSHGDMKATNVIMSAARPVLVDLDAMREHASNATSSRARERDRARFLRNWDEDPPVRRLFEELLAHSDSQPR